MNEVSRILSDIERGDPRAAAQLLPLVYDELRKLAAAKLALEKPGQTLEATALVHEAYIRLVASGNAGGLPDSHAQEQQWNSRGHFFAAAAEAMRRILVDRARHKRSHKGGGNRSRKDINDIEVAAPESSEDLLALDEALAKLADTDKKTAELVQLRFFAGLPLSEVARMLDISPRTADRMWAYARAWLHQEIQGESRKNDNS